MVVTGEGPGVGEVSCGGELRAHVNSIRVGAAGQQVVDHLEAAARCGNVQRGAPVIVPA